MRWRWKLGIRSPQLRQRVRFLRRFRFTRIGGRFVGITLLVSIAAFNTGNNPLYLVLGMLLSLILLSGLLSELTLKDLEVSRRLPSRIFAGQPVLVGLTLVNRKRHLPSFSLQVSERIEGLRQTDWPSSYVLRLDPGSRVETFYQHAFSRRGVWQLQGFEIATSFPFELFRKAVEIEDPQTVIVFPRPAPVQNLLLWEQLSGGSQLRPQAGQEGDYLSLRPYRPQDDVRSVHWKISAKRDQLVVRELERPRSQAIVLCFENRWQPRGESPEGHRNKLERAVERCAGILTYLIREGYPVALATLQERTAFGADLAHQDRLLTLLAQLTFVGDPQLNSQLKREPDPSAGFNLTPQDRCVLLAHPDQDGKSAPGYLIHPGLLLQFIPIE
ncbi:DUF58 domain-containing protein [Synechococcus sp. B60.2]|uniref:DUF58 domain-containing protein n=1 Tax=Synechococcus sp. B60.2 TaxID=2964523 RepID=UPI0039C1656B